MTPAARYAAAIEVLDRIHAGTPAEAALTTWARGHRFAGSKDRAAIRDHVFDVLRNYRSTSAMGGAATGRGQVLGLLRLQGIDPQTVFGADTYAPTALTAAELNVPSAEMGPGERLNLPDWLVPLWQADLGERAEEVAAALTRRAGVFLRVNLSRGEVDQAVSTLASDGIAAVPLPHIRTALQVTEGERKIAQSRAYQTGLVELQDPSGQDAMLQLAQRPASRVLDYCAGGGGKALALADLLGAEIVAHDANPARMSDLPARAARAGQRIMINRPEDLDPAETYDLVLCDAPCSGSGTWRRAPYAKSQFTEAALRDLQTTQDAVLTSGAAHTAPKGRLAYATCSVLGCENEQRVDAFLKRNKEFRLVSSRRWWPDAQQDGFFLAVMEKDGSADP